jgi:hypothetical protein
MTDAIDHGPRASGLDRLRQLTQSALFAVLARHEGEALPVRYVQSLVTGPQAGSYDFPYRAVPDTGSPAVAIEIEIEIEDHPAGQGLHADPDWPPGTPQFGRPVWMVIRRYLELAGAFKTDAAIFAQVWEEFLDYIARDSVHFTLSAPLQGFSADFETLAVADGVVIERVTEEWRRLRWEAASGFGLEEFARDGKGSWTHMVRCDAVMPKSPGAAPHEVRALAEQVVTAMRLIGPGSVAIGQSWLEPAPPAFHPFGRMGLGRPLG